jgi:hypothetical protein
MDRARLKCPRQRLPLPARAGSLAIESRTRNAKAHFRLPLFTSKLHTIRNAHRIMHIREFSLTSHVIIEEELVPYVVSPGTGPGACRRWEREKMNRHQNTRHTCVRAAAGPGPRIPKRLVPSRLRRCHIPKQIDCISRFKSKSFLENILGSNAGGRGVPRESALRTQPFRSQPDNAKVTPHR